MPRLCLQAVRTYLDSRPRLSDWSHFSPLCLLSSGTDIFKDDTTAAVTSSYSDSADGALPTPSIYHDFRKVELT
jgi:hypothetical protein